MQKILLTSGCSWTDPNYMSIEHPTLDCSWPKWPEILAEKLDMKCINLGKSGAGNEYIYSSILDQLQLVDHKQIGYVIAAWSSAPRRDFSNLDYRSSVQWNNDQEDVRGDLNYWLQKSIRYYYSFQTMMEYLKLPYVHMQMVSMYRGYIYSKLKEAEKIRNIISGRHEWEWSETIKSEIDKDGVSPHTLKSTRKGYESMSEVKTLALKTILNSQYKFNDKFLSWPTDEDIGGASVDLDIVNDRDKISMEDLHPNKVGQELIAKYIYEHI